MPHCGPFVGDKNGAIGEWYTKSKGYYRQVDNLSIGDAVLVGDKILIWTGSSYYRMDCAPSSAPSRDYVTFIDLNGRFRRVYRVDKVSDRTSDKAKSTHPSTPPKGLIAYRDGKIGVWDSQVPHLSIKYAMDHYDFVWDGDCVFHLEGQNLVSSPVEYAVAIAPANFEQLEAFWAKVPVNSLPRRAVSRNGDILRVKRGYVLKEWDVTGHLEESQLINTVGDNALYVWAKGKLQCLFPPTAETEPVAPAEDSSNSLASNPLHKIADGVYMAEDVSGEIGPSDKWSHDGYYVDSQRAIWKHQGNGSRIVGEMEIRDTVISRATGSAYSWNEEERQPHSNFLVDIVLLAEAASERALSNLPSVQETLPDGAYLDIVDAKGKFYYFHTGTKNLSTMFPMATGETVTTRKNGKVYYWDGKKWIFVCLRDGSQMTSKRKDTIPPMHSFEPAPLPPPTKEPELLPAPTRHPIDRFPAIIHKPVMPLAFLCALIPAAVVIPLAIAGVPNFYHPVPCVLIFFVSVIATLLTLLCADPTIVPIRHHYSLHTGRKFWYIYRGVEKYHTESKCEWGHEMEDVTEEICAHNCIENADRAVALFVRTILNSLRKGYPVVVHAAECSIYNYYSTSDKETITLVPSLLNTKVPFLMNPLIGSPLRSVPEPEDETVARVACLKDSAVRILTAAIQDNGESLNDSVVRQLILIALFSVDGMLFRSAIKLRDALPAETVKAVDKKLARI